jgi:hypothetical protein
VIRFYSPQGSVRRFARASVPLLAALLGCSGTIDTPSYGNAAGSGASGGKGSTVGAGGSKASGGSGGSKASAGSGNAGGGTGGVLGNAGSGGEVVEPESGPRPVSMVGAPLYTRFVRLTNAQWENAVRDILKLTAATGASDGFLEPVSGTTDFDNNERVVLVDNTIWADFQLAAEKVADKVTATDDALQDVVAGTDPENFIRTFGRRAFRRDLTAAEVTTFKALYDEGSTNELGSQSAYTKGINWVIAGMLQSPHFLYRVEMADNGAPLSGEEMATKLSFWLRDTTPTDAMLDGAASFATADGAASQAETMLGEPATAAVVRKFHDQLYAVPRYDTITKDNVQGYTSALNAELKEAASAFFDRIYTQGLGVRDIVTSTVGFAGPAMARLYGITMQGSGLQQVDLPDRVGYYAQMPFLTLWAINNDPDSIHRGVRINLDTLCADPGLPDEVPPLPPLEEGQTNRERVSGLTGACARVCHGEIINPIGFSFEEFDGLGRFRDMDNGQPVNTAGRYPFAEGTQEFANSGELMGFIANGTQAHQCYAKKMASYATARDLVESERPLVVELGAVSQASGASLKQIMVALVKTDAFRTHVGGAQ